MDVIRKELTDKFMKTIREEHLLFEKNAVTGGLLTDEMPAKGKFLDIILLAPFARYSKGYHNHIAIIYMISGSSTHIINDSRQVILKQGDLLLLNQNTREEILPFGSDDTAVIFTVLPEFFDTESRLLAEENLLMNFLVDFLRQEFKAGGYLYYKVSDIIPVQNLLENMLWPLLNKQPYKPKLNQAMLELLFYELLNYTSRIQQPEEEAFDTNLTLSILCHIEESYKDSNLTLLAKELDQPVYLLSRLIKRNTGYTYKELLQKKRFQKAVELLETTALSVNDIISAVGYDNTSYFHRVFREKYNMSPRQYRLQKK